MNPSNRGQGAFEYLMAYGWAIIVLMIIGATLWYLGVFNVEQTGVTVSGFSKIKPLETSILLTPDGNFSGIFINGAGYVINVSNITITNMVGPPAQECNVTNGTGNIRRDEQFWIRATDCVDGLRSKGTPYTLYVNISYSGRVGSTDISRRERGTIHGFYEFYLQVTTTSVTTTSTIALPACSETTCGATNPTLPCSCGTATADVGSEWCCSADNAVFGDQSTCEVSIGCLPVCSETTCGAANSILPCACGTATADATNPWCCSADSHVASDETACEVGGCAPPLCSETTCGAANPTLPCSCGTATADVGSEWCCSVDNAVFGDQPNCEVSPSCTATTLTTTIPSSSVMICSNVYDCGDIDSVCPGDYGVSCSDPDC